MLVVFVVAAASACTHNIVLGVDVSFGKFFIDTDETVCIRVLSPRTSVLFRRSPPISVTAQYPFENRTVTLTTKNATAGFDSGLYTGNLVVTARRPGKFSYFAVTFPSDCDVRIVSSERKGVLMRGASTGKVCYFNGGKRRASYDIHVVAGAGGRLAAPRLNLTLTGVAAHHIGEENATLIVWEGAVTQVAVAVSGGRRHGHGIVREFAGTGAPALLERTAEELPHGGRGHHGGHRGRGDHEGHGEHEGHEGRGRHEGEEDDDEEGCSGARVVVAHVFGLLLVVWAVVKVVKCVRRRRRRVVRERDADAIPPVQSSAEPAPNYIPPYVPVAALYPGQQFPQWPAAPVETHQ